MKHPLTWQIRQYPNEPRAPSHVHVQCIDAQAVLPQFANVTALTSVSQEYYDFEAVLAACRSVIGIVRNAASLLPTLVVATGRCNVQDDVVIKMDRACIYNYDYVLDKHFDATCVCWCKSTIPAILFPDLRS